jgi:hypothetical protein
VSEHTRRFAADVLNTSATTNAVDALGRTNVPCMVGVLLNLNRSKLVQIQTCAKHEHAIPDMQT